MFLFNRKALAPIGVAVAATTTLLAAPAQASTVGVAEVVGEFGSIVSFTAGPDKVNSLTITQSGWTIVLDDRVAIKAGPGCEAVRGDRTKVKCPLSIQPTEVSVDLRDENDRVSNKATVLLYAVGGSGSDTMSSTSNYNRLLGGSGNDKLYGGSGTNGMEGGAGNDTIYGGSGTDEVEGGTGNDTIYGGKGHDWLSGGPEADTIYGQAGDDTLIGGPGRDRLYGGPGTDSITP
jgi:Ca2+-binding RTX toxin-like protein